MATGAPAQPSAAMRDCPSDRRGGVQGQLTQACIPVRVAAYILTLATSRLGCRLVTCRGRRADENETGARPRRTPSRAAPRSGQSTARNPHHFAVAQPIPLRTPSRHRWPPDRRGEPLHDALQRGSEVRGRARGLSTVGVFRDTSIASQLRANRGAHPHGRCLCLAAALVHIDPVAGPRSTSHDSLQVEAGRILIRRAQRGVIRSARVGHRRVHAST